MEIGKKNIEILAKWSGKLDSILNIARSLNDAVNQENEGYDFEADAIQIGELVTPEMLNDLSFIKDIYNRKNHPRRK